METLQTIWTALTTPNEVLTSILVLPMYFIEAYISMLLFTLLFNIETTKKQKALYLLVVGCTGIIIKLFFDKPYNAYLNVISIVLSIIFILKVHFWKAIFALSIPFFATAIIESIVANLYSFIFLKDYSSAINIPIQRLALASIVYCIIFIIYVILKYYKLAIPKLEIFNKKNIILLTLTIILGIILIATQLYVTFYYSSVLPLFIVILSICSLLAYFLISMYTIFTVSKLETTSTSLEEAQLYNKTLQILHDNIRAFKHDF